LQRESLPTGKRFLRQEKAEESRKTIGKEDKSWKKKILGTEKDIF